MNPPLQTPLLVCFPLFLLFVSSSLKLKADVVARPGCNANCGSVSIPFPFGVGVGCFLDPWFEIQCNGSDSKKPFLSKFNIEVMDITIPDYSNRWLQSVTVGMPSLNGCGAHTKGFGIDLRGSPYNFSTDYNVFLMEGCAGSTILIDQSNNNAVLAGCSTVCLHRNTSANLTNKCYGDGVDCCQMQLPSEKKRDYSPLQFYEIGFYGQSPGEHHNCLAATLIKNDSVDQYIGNLSTSYQNPSTVPVLLYWSWVSSHWPDPNPNADCRRDQSTNIIHCTCNGKSAGNPFVLNGCQRQVPCKNCHGFCTRKQENSSYTCENGKRFNLLIVIAIISLYIGIAVGPSVTVFGCVWLYRFIKRRRKTERRVKFFKLKLQQHQSSNEGFVERTRLFTRKQLDKATDHFNENRILGRGGQGIVYKGMLIDGTIVAIKKPSKLTDEGQMEQFINEVVVLSTINHRNVVKLLGCCLETQVPLLVYEFISNGTLSQHIHNPSDNFVLSWAMRLKIAADSAGAIAYLHASSSPPVYHRDIKPCNILLDDKHRAKVSDFGSSKTIEIDQTHLTTLVQGTFGYLDPEYFESGVFTDKSDVYSFGVVLLELLTSKKPVYRTETMEQKVLVTEFFLQMQNSSLSNLLDPELVKEGKEEELIAVAHLARCCLNGSGRVRPTMKEVSMTLEMIINSPAEMSTHDQQTSQNEGFSEILMAEMSEVEFMSSTVPTSATSPLYIDVQPLLRDTI